MSGSPLPAGQRGPDRPSAEPKRERLMGSRNGRFAVRFLAATAVAVVVTAAALLASGVLHVGSAASLPTVTVQGAVVPLPNGWRTVAPETPFTILSARPRSGIGQESVRIGQATTDAHTLASEFVRVADLGTSGANISETSASGVPGTRSCWLVAASYQLLRQAAQLHLRSLDLFCSRQNGTVVHVNLVLPDTPGSASLLWRFLRGLSL
jgi:hypothetical protein